MVHGKSLIEITIKHNVVKRNKMYIIQLNTKYENKLFFYFILILSIKVLYVSIRGINFDSAIVSNSNFNFFFFIVLVITQFVIINTIHIV